MSSNIHITRICKFCNSSFTARTTVTQYCGDTCAKRAYKARMKVTQIASSNKETHQLIINKPIDDLKTKEFLTVKETAKILNSSTKTIYNLIENGKLKAVNLSQRKTLIKRSQIDDLFN